jgi:hypothetical protein
MVSAVEDAADVTAVTASCSSCGYSRRQVARSARISAQPVDWYFGLELWLQTPCCGEVLWALNPDHLAFLTDFVSARLRERAPSDVQFRNKRLTSRLPRWMTSAKNRHEVLRGLERLAEMGRPR